ncbi:unnamed protein product [Clonostachys rosea]|uniref:BZIP domain-containing protein n=1 Tax=Bionectria ochroleuca TaxID=29856 RepID=A0ABY6UTZ2_BIOOC|nr:unnamed protein product [Clonostachys rosea]
MTIDEGVERRRLQNRIAQRRFRQKHSKKKTDSLPPDQIARHEVNGGTGVDHQLHAHLPTASTSEEITSAITADSANAMGGLGLCTPVSNLHAPSPPDALPASLEAVLSNLSNDLPLIGNLTSKDLSLMYPESLSTGSHSIPIETNNTPPIDPSLSDVASSGEDSGWMSTLHMAAQKGHEGIMCVLLEHSTNINERDSDGRTALMHAVIHGHANIIMLLLERGARPGDLDNRRQSALYWAVVQRNAAILKILLEHCVREKDMVEQIDSYDSSFRTPLHTAVDLGFEEGVRLLLSFGANLHCRARMGI